MISFALAFMMMLAPSYGSGAVAEPKKALNACLTNITKEKLQAKVAPDAFESALGSACAVEAARFREAIVAQRVAAKVKRADAEQIAAGDAEDIFLNAKEMYREYAERNTQPQ